MDSNDIDDRTLSFIAETDDTIDEEVSPGNTALDTPASMGTEELPDPSGVATGTAIAIPASSAMTTAATADEITSEAAIVDHECESPRRASTYHHPLWLSSRARPLPTSPIHIP